MTRLHDWINAVWAALQHRYTPFTEPRVLGVLMTLILIPRLFARGAELINSDAPASQLSVYVEPTSMIWGVGMLVAGVLMTFGLVFRRTVLLALGHVLALAVFGGYSIPLTVGVLEAGRTYSAIWTSGLMPVAGHALRLWVLQFEIRRSFYGTRQHVADR